jgi:hypothetical protein
MGRTWAAIFLRDCRHAHTHASAKSCYALPRFWPPLFCPFSGEAYLPTGKKKPRFFVTGLTLGFRISGAAYLLTDKKKTALLYHAFDVGVPDFG